MKKNSVIIKSKTNGSTYKAIDCKCEGERGIYLYKIDVFNNLIPLGFRSEWYAEEVCEHNIDDLALNVDSDYKISK